MRTFFLLSFVLLLSFLSYGQQPGQAASGYVYREHLPADSVKARQLDAVMLTYKRAMASVASDTTLSVEARQARFGELIAEKNRQLGLLLSREQQQKIIPLSERARSTPGANPSGSTHSGTQ